MSSSSAHQAHDNGSSPPSDTLARRNRCVSYRVVPAADAEGDYPKVLSAEDKPHAFEVWYSRDFALAPTTAAAAAAAADSTIIAIPMALARDNDDGHDDDQSLQSRALALASASSNAFTSTDFLSVLRNARRDLTGRSYGSLRAYRHGLRGAIECFMRSTPSHVLRAAKFDTGIGSPQYRGLEAEDGEVLGFRVDFAIINGEGEGAPSVSELDARHLARLKRRSQTVQARSNAGSGARGGQDGQSAMSRLDAAVALAIARAKERASAAANERGLYRNATPSLTLPGAGTHQIVPMSMSDMAMYEQISLGRDAGDGFVLCSNATHTSHVMMPGLFPDMDERFTAPQARPISAATFSSSFSPNASASTSAGSDCAVTFGSYDPLSAPSAPSSTAYSVWSDTYANPDQLCSLSARLASPMSLPPHPASNAHQTRDWSGSSYCNIANPPSHAWSHLGPSSYPKQTDGHDSLGAGEDAGVPALLVPSTTQVYPYPYPYPSDISMPMSMVQHGFHCHHQGGGPEIGQRATATDGDAEQLENPYISRLDPGSGS